MAEVFVSFNDTLIADGIPYRARACGREAPDGRWEGWLEFESLDGGSVVRSGRETTQPNRTDLAYWATGLTPVYLEGALDRSLHPTIVTPPVAPELPTFDGPRPDLVESNGPPPGESVLNPFSVYRKGEALLRSQLKALAAWHLVNIIESYELSEQSTDQLNLLTAPQLVELIVAEVSRRTTVDAI